MSMSAEWGKAAVGLLVFGAVVGAGLPSWLGLLLLVGFMFAR